MRPYPHQGLDNWLMNTFYNGLLYNTRIIIDITIGVGRMNKPFNDANTLIENMVHNHYQWGSEHIFVENS